MSLVVRKPAFCICENKDADQLRGDREADQRLCFRYIDSTIPLLPKSEIFSLYPSSVTAQPGLCRTWSKTLKTGFLTTRLILMVEDLCMFQLISSKAQLEKEVTRLWDRVHVLWERLDVPLEEQDLFSEGKEGFKPHVIEAVSEQSVYLTLSKPRLQVVSD